MQEIRGKKREIIRIKEWEWDGSSIPITRVVALPSCFIFEHVSNERIIRLYIESFTFNTEDIIQVNKNPNIYEVVRENEEIIIRKITPDSNNKNDLPF